MIRPTHLQRLFLFALLAGLAFAGLATRLYVLQVLRHDKYKDIVGDNTQRVFLKWPRRGDILDVNGHVLATSLPVKRVLADPSLPGKGPGRSENGNFVLNEFKIFFSPDGDPKKFKEVKLQSPKATFSQDGFAINLAIDNNPDTGWAIAPQVGKNHTAVFEGKARVGNTQGGVLKFEMLQKFQGKLHNIGRFRLSVTTQKPPIQLQLVPESIAKIIDLPDVKRSQQQKEALTNYYRSLDPELARLQRLEAELVVPADARTMAAQDVAWALMNTPAFLFNR